LQLGLAIADSLQERLRWSEYFCGARLSSGVNRFSFQEHPFSTTIGDEMVYGLPGVPGTDLLEATAVPYEHKLSSILLD
jgi:hypothetical protein